MFRSHNVTARIFERQICSPAPGTSVNRARRFYENIVPSHTVFDIECPNIIFRRFSNDGQYLITFSRNHQHLIVYRPTWLSFSCREQQHCCYGQHDLPSKANKFESFFTQLYSLTLASTGELISKDFFLYVEENQFGLFATSTAQVHDAPATGGAVPGIPSIEKITFHLVRMEDGVILDEKVFHNDYINLAHSMGVYLYDDLVAVVSLRYQRIHILQIRDSGHLVDVRLIGEYCREDDELFLSSSAQCTSIPDRNSMNSVANGLHQDQHSQEVSFLGGLKQRLLSFIFQGFWSEEDDPVLRLQCLKKKFYYHFHDYADLILWKVQFLDRHHLLIKFGSVDGGVARNTDNHPAFFAVYNMETTEIISFHQSSSDELYTLFEVFYDHFHSSSKNSFYMNFLSTHSNNIHALEQLRSTRNKASSLPQLLYQPRTQADDAIWTHKQYRRRGWDELTWFVKKMLSTLPINCQSQSPSPYFDHSLFRYDEKVGLASPLISAMDRHRQSTDHPIKFISRRQPNILKFKIKPEDLNPAVVILGRKRSPRFYSIRFCP
ncbi:acid phosphatase det1 [Orobanche gracilis]